MRMLLVVAKLSAADKAYHTRALRIENRAKEHLLRCYDVSERFCQYISGISCSEC